MTISLPGSSLCSRCHVLSARRSSPERAASVASCCSAPRFPREAGDGAIERGGRLRAVPAPRLPFDQIDRQLRVVGQAAHQLLQRRGRSRLRSRAGRSSAINAPPDLDVARRRRQRGPRGLERAFQIAQRVAHPAQHVPFDGAGRAFQLARQLGQRAAAARHRERDRPDGAAALGIARRKLAQSAPRGRAATRAASAGSPPASRRRAARSASSSFAAAWPGRSRASRTSAAATGLPARSSASARRSAISSRVRFGARQLAQQRDGLCPGRALVGGVPGAGQDGERGVDEAAARRRAALELQRVVVRAPARRRRRPRPRARALGRRAPARTAARPAGPGRTPRPPPSRHRARAAGERRRRAARTRAVAAVGRRTFGARAKPLAQPRPTVASRQLDQAPREVVVVGAFQQRALGAFDQRARIRAVNLPVGARRHAAATGTSRAVTSARRRTPER